MSGELAPVDLTILVLYLLGIVALGVWFARRSGNTSEFMAAGGRLPGWAVGLSILGTYVSSISFMANPQSSYEGNWNAFVFSLSLPIAAVVASRFFVPFYRQGGHISAYEHLEERFGTWARIYAAVCYLLIQLARMGTIMFLVALALAPLTGWSLETIILVTGVSVTLYTLVGGIEAVIWTDVVQAVVLTGGAVFCVAVMALGMPEGPGQLVEVALANDKFSLGQLGPSLQTSTVWIVFIYGLTTNLQNFGIDQSYVQRYLTARTEAEARRSIWIGTCCYLPISALLFLIGTGLFAFYSTRPESLPEGIAAKEVFPYFIATSLPTGASGLLIAAVLASAMSSVDSSLNCSATLVLEDFYKRLWRGGQASERESMWVLYSATVFWGALGTGAALAMIRVEQVLDAWWRLSGIFSGGMLGLFLLGIISRRAKRPGAVAGVVTGVLVIFWMVLSRSGDWPAQWSQWRNPLHSYLTIVVGTLTILFVGLLVSRIGNGFSRRADKRA